MIPKTKKTFNHLSALSLILQLGLSYPLTATPSLQSDSSSETLPIEYSTVVRVVKRLSNEDKVAIGVPVGIVGSVMVVLIALLIAGLCSKDKKPRSEQPGSQLLCHCEIDDVDIGSVDSGGGGDGGGGGHHDGGGNTDSGGHHDGGGHADAGGNADGGAGGGGFGW
ncbi:unnamed protein product [Ambrosiozyma monospora]|uniref:Unnamed protein product n=1 Tax=Ambrosiozyma monospora TaxID=43982 RepID=A0ACB5U9N1_AMBMO|nr:unnamed protein product [Ambrosiozyma monospora]